VRRSTIGVGSVLALALLVASAVTAVTHGEGPLSPVGVFLTTAVLVGAVAGIALTLILRLDDARRQTGRALAQVDSMVRNAPVGMAFVDRDRRFVEINETLATLSERTVADTIGMRLDDLPRLPPQVIDLVTDVIASGESKLDVPFGEAGVQVRAGYYPVRGADGTIIGAGILVREVSAEAQRDLLFERVSRLQELTAALVTAGTVDDVIAVAVRSIRRAVDASAASFCLLDGDTVVVAGSVGYPEEITARWCDFPVAEHVPLADAIRGGAPVLHPDRASILAAYPHLESSLVWGESMALAALPLRGEAGVIGAVGISFGTDTAFDIDAVAFLTAVATQCATAYERAVAFEAERRARREAETTSARLRYLSESTKVLSQSLDPTTLLQRLAELAVPALSDWCAVHLVEDDHARPVAVVGEQAEATATVRELSERNPIPLDAPAGLAAVVRTGEPIVLRSVTMEAVRASTDRPELIDLLSRLRAIAILPMAFQGRVLGTITLSNTTDRELADADVDLAAELAARAAQAIANAQLYQDRALVAMTLQASLLPPSPALIPGIDVARRFVPAAAGMEVGGDFYDVFRLGTVDAPAPTWALVIGDVRGKGADAAAITGIARATIRATALDERSPAAMLDRLNQVLLATARDDRFAADTGEPRFCTACLVTVTPKPGGADLVIAAGGHPLPYVLRADGTVEQVGVHGGLIGVLGEPGIVDVTAELGDGDALVLYTDGITEQHQGTVYFDEDALAEVLAISAGCDAEELVERVELGARGIVDAAPRDDLAILVARVPQRATTDVLGRRFLPEDDSAPRLARRFVADALAGLGVEPPATDHAVLLASELVTNALLHGAPPVHIEVLQVSRGVRISVTDEHPDVPSQRGAGRDDEHGRGLVLVEAFAARWGIDARPPGKAVWFEIPA